MDLNNQWVWCRLCERPTVICPVCGNNGCNGGSGDNGNCKVCDEVHKFQHEAYNGKEPKRQGLREFGTSWTELGMETQ